MLNTEFFTNAEKSALVSALNAETKSAEKIFTAIKNNSVIMAELKRIAGLPQADQSAEVTALCKNIFCTLFDSDKTSFTAYKLGGIVSNELLKKHCLHFFKDWYQINGINPANFFTLANISPLKGQSKYDPRYSSIKSTVNGVFLGLAPVRNPKKSNADKILDLVTKANGLEILESELPAIRKALEDLVSSLAIIQDK